MSEAQGFVSIVSEDGWAEVVFYTSDSGIPGASDIKTCHCSGGSAKLVIKAQNRADSGVGDLVLVNRTPGALRKSAATLFGIPAIGLLSGIVAGMLLFQRVPVHETVAVMVAIAGLSLGVIIAIIRYKKMSAEGQLMPVITRVIRKAGQEASSLMAIDPVCKMEVHPATAAASLDYQGRTYYFCAIGCREAFVSDPTMYL